MHLSEEEFMKASCTLPEDIIDFRTCLDGEPVEAVRSNSGTSTERAIRSKVSPTGQVAMGVAYMNSKESHLIQPDMSPTREHIDEMEIALEKNREEWRARIKELQEAHRVYTQASERTGKMLKKYGVEL